MISHGRHLQPNQAGLLEAPFGFQSLAYNELLSPRRVAFGAGTQREKMFSGYLTNWDPDIIADSAVTSVLLRKTPRSL